jgi:hypothetical protein
MTLATVFSADDGCDVGEDTGASVSPDYGPRGNAFNGGADCHRRRGRKRGPPRLDGGSPPHRHGATVNVDGQLPKPGCWPTIIVGLDFIFLLDLRHTPGAIIHAAECTAIAGGTLRWLRGWPWRGASNPVEERWLFFVFQPGWGEANQGAVEA